MASSFAPSFSTPAPARLRPRAHAGQGGRRTRRSSMEVPLVLAGVLLTLAVLVAPERPGDQEAICHRHNGVAACRVW